MEGRLVDQLSAETTLTDTDNLLIGKNNTLKRITFANVKTVLRNIIGNASSSASGLMSSTDKTNLDNATAVIPSDATSSNKLVSASTILSTLSNYPKMQHLTLGAAKSCSFTLNAAHSYRLTLGHPNINNKSGHYIVYCQNSTTSKVENLSTQSNYTITVSGFTCTITSTSDYGLCTVEDLGNYDS